MNGILFPIIIITVFVLIFVSFILFIRFIKREESRQQRDLFETALKTKHLDIEVNVVHKDRTVLLFFYLGLILFCGEILVLARTIILWDESSMDMLLFSPILLTIPLMFMVPFWPFGRKGRLVISDKLIFLPEWTLRGLPLSPTIFRVQNIEYVEIHYKWINKNKIDMVTFGDNVWAVLKLSRKDYSKYEEILNCLRGLEIKVKQ